MVENAIKRLPGRYENILKILVDEHIKTARPVGSRTISRRMGGAISPATVRNIMQDLEEMGLVMQPHTSAGRVPTASAFKYYVTHIMKPKRLSPTEKQKIEEIFLADFSDILELLENLGTILAKLSKELGFIVAPAGEELILHRIELIPIAENKVVMVLVTRSGLTRSIMMDVKDRNIKNFELLGQLLNERLSGLTFTEIKKTIAKRLSDLERLYGSFMTRLIKSAKEIFRISEEYAELFGRENIIEKPEFSDAKTLRKIIELSEQNRELIRCIDPDSMADNVEIVFNPPPLRNISLIVAKYPFGSTTGMIGLIGPMRMNYPKLVKLVSFAAKRLTSVWQS